MFPRHVLFCLSDVLLQRYDSDDFEKKRFSQNWQLYITFTSQFALNSKSCKIWKNGNRMASLQRYDAANFELILKKRLIYTVGSCTLWPKMGLGEDRFQTSMCGMAKD